MFDAVLIANRGEIACRVIRTCRRLGIRTVAVFSQVDRDALFTRLADEAYALGGAAPEDSYLRADRILDVARRAGVQAVHPGYGFLSENAEFAQACQAASLRFIGPSPQAIRAMGLKDRAKALMERAGVPVVPGYHGGEQADARLLSEAQRIGFPVLIKAVAGGGGKGMRRAADAREFAAALHGARREAQAAFGDARLLVERYVSQPRHIEVQVFADAHGNVVHLFERDCSLQRRHQKVIEEAPAAGLSEALRQAMGQAAVQAARAVDYEGAGTVEFIVDGTRGLSDGPFYFMEMNTRLQVEHPVTELITGIDLVEWQLRVACGERLPLRQDQLQVRGHAVEARLYAEDPARGYLPQTGQLVHLVLPAESDHVRLETGVVQGDRVSVHYDPMIAKLVVWDADRAGACRWLRRALDACEIAGLTHNVPLLRAVSRHPAFVRGDVDTEFLETHLSELLVEDEAEVAWLWVLACVGIVEARQQQAAPAPAASPWRDTRGFRLNEPARDVLNLVAAGRPHQVGVTFQRDGALQLELPQGTWPVADAALSGDVVSCSVSGQRLSGRFVRGRDRVFVMRSGRALELSLAAPGATADEGVAGLGAVRAPLPGRVISVSVAVGASVRKGEALLCIEAMKMEHTLRAPVDGVVQELRAAPQAQVEEGTTLLVLGAPQES